MKFHFHTFKIERKVGEWESGGMGGRDKGLGIRSDVLLINIPYINILIDETTMFWYEGG